MAKRSITARLDDIGQAIAHIQSITSANGRASFDADKIGRLAVERCLEIISEASRYIPPQLTDKHPEVPWADIRGIGNQLRHAYDQLDGDIIWNTATISVPELKIVIEAMIATLEADTQEPSP